MWPSSLGARGLLQLSPSEERGAGEDPWNSLPILVRAKPGRDTHHFQPEPIRKNLVPYGLLNFNRRRNGEWILGDS